MNGDVTKTIVAFLNAHELAVISTVHADRNAPESAIVGFGHTEALELIFGTPTSARKYRNLLTNPHVSFVIGWSSETGSLQYEGVARELTREQARAYGTLLIAKNEDHRTFLTLEDQRYFIVTPSRVRFFDNAAHPPTTHEITF